MDPKKFLGSAAGDIKRNLIFASFLMLLLYAIGIFFYTHVEGWGLIDSAFFLTATFTTIGYGDIVPKTDTGKVFTMIIAWVGISTGFFLLYSIAAYREKVLDRQILGRLQLVKSLLVREDKAHHPEYKGISNKEKPPEKIPELK